MKTLFDDERITVPAAVAETAASLRAYGASYDHWALAFSGGKDSSAALTCVVHLLERGEVPRPKSLTVLYADTRMELPPLHTSAMLLLDEVRRRSFETRIVLPELDRRFYVYMLGRGVPPPKNRFRWCTPSLKIDPMYAALRGLRDSTGHKLLMLTGVRLGESAARDQRISLSCSRDGGECGQGWFQAAPPAAVADTLAPILHWRQCNVYDWLFFDAVQLGFNARLIAEAYGLDAGSGEEPISARTGCIACPLASRDGALDRLCRLPAWKYLTPLKQLRRVWDFLTQHRNRIRKDGSEVRKDGTLVKNPGRVGPLTFEARLWGLKTVLAIQSEVNDQARAQRRPEVTLINQEEEARIRQLIDLGTWPQGWDGSELPGHEDVAEVYADGSMQGLLLAD